MMNKKLALWWHLTPIKNSLKQEVLGKIGDYNVLFDKTHEWWTIQLGRDIADKIEKSKKNLAHYEDIINTCLDKGIQIITIKEEQYPKLLKEIPDAPMCIFVKGNAQALNKPMIAIVGSRKCSEYGFDVAKYLGKMLSLNGITVVSGLAKGIDEAAHKGTINNGSTVAVMGTGVDVCYPVQNRQLYQSILEQGCIVSEFVPGTKGLPYHFPMRNRIISGMSLGSVIIEAAEESGSLITAQLALEQNREVFAVPGNIFSKFSVGTNKLIQAGAKLVMTEKDIIEELSNEIRYNSQLSEYGQANSMSISLDKVEVIVYDCLSQQPVQVEQLYQTIVKKESAFNMSQLEMILLQLEMKGIVQRLPARRYSRIK
ncbi:MAG: DNA-processing protein DprA [Cellulosilyticaceae bacterium]